tara:strand:- start:4 stop:693 length:690 start_codon:yes stop_codon:yes gene_type:complete
MNTNIGEATADELEELLANEDPDILCDAACALGDLIRTKELSTLSVTCVEKLALLLGHPSFLVQLEVAIAMAEIQDHRGTPLLLAAIRRKRFRLDALRALGTMNDSKASEDLRSWIKRRFAPWADKLQAAAALSKMGDPEGQTYLERKLSSKKAPERAAAIHFLAESNHPSALHYLSTILRNPQDPMRDVAARSLGLLGNPEARPLLEQSLLKAPATLADDIKEALNSL